MSNYNVNSSLGYALLGLLRERPGSGYEIRRVFDSALLRRFSSSPGSIYPALKRLQEKGMVAREGSERRGRFAITERGRKALVAWLSAPLSADDVEQGTDILILKFAFMEGLLSPPERRTFLTAFERAVEDHLDDLTSTREASMGRISLHGRLTLDHQIAVTEANRSWVRLAAKQLEGS